MNLGAWVLAAATFLAPHRTIDAVAREWTRAIESEAPLFESDATHIETAAILVAVGFRESSFRDVVSSTNDHGYFQLHDRADLIGHPYEQAKEALRMIRASLQHCGGLQDYVGGGCKNARATRISNDRLALAGKLLASVGLDTSAAIARGGR